LARQDANPLTGALGDVFLFGSGSTQALRMASSATPRWDDVAAVRSTSTTNTAFAGGGQGSAIEVCDHDPLTVVTTVASAGDSAKFPASAILGKVCTVKNKGANSMNLFPPSGGDLCLSGSACAGTNTALAVAANVQYECWHQGSNVWNCK
jgi:hypothetical protein